MKSGVYFIERAISQTLKYRKLWNELKHNRKPKWGDLFFCRFHSHYYYYSILPMCGFVDKSNRWFFSVSLKWYLFNVQKCLPFWNQNGKQLTKCVTHLWHRLRFNNCLWSDFVMGKLNVHIPNNAIKYRSSSRKHIGLTIILLSWAMRYQLYRSFSP